MAGGGQRVNEGEGSEYQSRKKDVRQEREACSRSMGQMAPRDEQRTALH